jgi:DNA-3-methyladenine glycosylase II
MALVLRLPPPSGFDFAATAEAVRRGPGDPLNRWDGTRWRRMFAAGGGTLLLQVSLCPKGAEPGLAVRSLAGSAPPDVVRRLVTRIFGLDDPGAALALRAPAPLRRLIRSHAGALLPGYPTLFEALAQTIMGQQLHVLVANRHRAAFIQVFGTRHEYRGRAYWTFPDPARVAGARVPHLRRTGLSRVKAGAILAIARNAADGRLSEERLARMPAGEAIDELCALPGVGQWTGEWVLLRALRRFEIVPAGDLTIRKAVTWALGAADLLAEPRIRDAIASWGRYGGLIADRLTTAYLQSIAKA